MQAKEYQRMDLAKTRQDARRPGVYLLQAALLDAGYDPNGVDGVFGKGTLEAVREIQDKSSLTVDGVVGKGTWTAVVRAALSKGHKPDLARQVHSLISYFEVGTRQNAYGMAEPDIGDGAGANYGVLQHNKHGSLVHVLKMGGRADLVALYLSTDKTVPQPAIQQWMGTRTGMDAQDAYYKAVVVRSAYRMIDKIPIFAAWNGHALLHRFFERAFTMMCDTITQNGSFFSGDRKPFWKSITDDEAKVPDYRELYHGTWWDELLGRWVPYSEMKRVWLQTEKDCGGDRRAANQKCLNALLPLLPDAEKQLVMAAQWRARTSREKYWRVVADRRMLDATGEWSVYGTKINLARDFCIGLDTADFKDRDNEKMEDFAKDVGLDILSDLGLD